MISCPTLAFASQSVDLVELHGPTLSVDYVFFDRGHVTGIEIFVDIFNMCRLESLIHLGLRNVDGESSQIPVQV